MNAYDIATVAHDAVMALDYKKLGREEWRAQSALVEKQFEGDLAAEFPTPIPDLVFAKAWSDGHSSGFHEVAYHYESLAEILQAAVAVLTSEETNK